MQNKRSVYTKPLLLTFTRLHRSDAETRCTMRTYNGKRILITLTLACLLVFGLVRVCNSSESTAQASVDQSKISYVSVLIHSSDTLSSIANEYYCDAFGSVQDYAEAIQEYNSLDSDLIYAGNHLMVPVYQAN